MACTPQSVRTAQCHSLRLLHLHTGMELATQLGFQAVHVALYLLVLSKQCPKHNQNYFLSSVQYFPIVFLTGIKNVTKEVNKKPSESAFE